MIQIKNIQELANTHGLQVTGTITTEETIHNEKGSTRTRANICLIFDLNKPNPKAWALFCSETFAPDIDISIIGTRELTASGATDGLLLPQYQEILPKVNAARKANGLIQIWS